MKLENCSKWQSYSTVSFNYILSQEHKLTIDSCQQRAHVRNFLSSDDGGHAQWMWNSTVFSEKRSESRSQQSVQKYQYFEWGSTLNLDGFKIIIFQYMICESFRYWKEGLTKLDVKPVRNLVKIQMSPKARSMSYPPACHQLSDTATCQVLWQHCSNSCAHHTA